MKSKIENGTWEFFKNSGLWHFNKDSTTPNFKILGRFIGDWKKELTQLNYDQLKGIKNTMSHKKSTSYYSNIEKGNEIDFKKYGFDKDLKYGFVNDNKLNSKSIPKIFEAMKEKIDLNDSYVKFTKQMPGQSWPIHFDNYHALRPNLDKENWEDPKIRRIWIALEDWDWGHYVLFGNTPWHGWKAGDILYFDWLIPHGTANCGNSPRQSMFVTGRVSDSLEEWLEKDLYKEFQI